MKNSIALILSSTLLATACGKSSSSDDKPETANADNQMVPPGFQNTTDAADFQKRNADVRQLMGSVEQQFGMKVSSRDQKKGAQLWTQSALEAFVGSKADSSMLSRSLEVDATLTLITRILSDKPSSCTTAVATLEALYTSLTASASEAIEHTDTAQLQKTADDKGLTLEEQPKTADEALSFKLSGNFTSPRQTLNQELNFAAGANDQLIFIKRDAKVSNVMIKPAQGDQPAQEWGHYNYTATGGLTADLVAKKVVLIDQRQANFDMIRGEKGIKGSSQLDVSNVVQGGELPSLSSKLLVDLSGIGLEDEAEHPLYDEHRQFESNLVKVDANTLRLSLNLASQGVRGDQTLTVTWQLQKNEKGECSVSRVAN